MKIALLSFTLAQMALVSCATKSSTAEVAGLKDLEAKELWQVTEGIENPESVLFDSKTDSIYVSNVAGQATAKDGNGWISKLDEDGKVVAPKWISGLNAPKGLAVSHGVLWIADIDTLLGASLSDGKIIHKFPISGAKFLNDVAVDDDGNVFVSDMFDQKIYKTAYKSKEFSAPKVFLEGESNLRGPNGLTFKDEKLVVAQWGIGIKDDFSTNEPGNVVSFKNDKAPSNLITKGLGNIDGIEVYKGGFLYSDFIKGDVGVITKKGEAKVLLNLGSGAADIGLQKDKNVLLVPHMNKNTITAYKLSE